MNSYQILVELNSKLISENLTLTLRFQAMFRVDYVPVPSSVAPVAVALSLALSLAETRG